jgi:hypothetical protein
VPQPPGSGSPFQLGWRRLLLGGLPLGIPALAIPLALLSAALWVVPVALSLAVGMGLAGLSYYLAGRQARGTIAALLVTTSGYALVAALLVLAPWDRADDWEDFAPPGQGFIVSFPGKPEQSWQDLGNDVRARQFQVIHTAEGTGFFVHAIDLANVNLRRLPSQTPKVNELEFDTEGRLLDFMRFLVDSAYAGGNVRAALQGNVNGHPGDSFTITMPDGVKVVRQGYVIGRRIYFVTVSSSRYEAIEAKAKRFLDSFEVIDPNTPVEVALKNRHRPVGTADDKGRVIFKGHGFAVHSLCFSPDGHRMLSRDELGTVIIWDPATTVKTDSFRLKEGNEFPRPFAFAPGGRLAVHCNTRDQLALVDFQSRETKKELIRLPSDQRREGLVVFSPDGRYLFGHFSRPFLNQKAGTIWEVPGGRVLGTVEEWYQSGGSAVFSPDGTRLAVCSKPTCQRRPSRHAHAQPRRHRQEVPFRRPLDQAVLDLQADEGGPAP